MIETEIKLLENEIPLLNVEISDLVRDLEDFRTILDEMYPVLKFLKKAAGGKGISKNVMAMTLREHTEIVHPLEPRRIKTEFVRNPFGEEIYIALKKGDYAYVHRSREKEAKKI